MRGSLVVAIITGAFVVAGCGQPTLVSCPADLSPCADGCMDMASDPNNCGACGHACDQNAGCVTGSCMQVHAGVCDTNNGGCSTDAQCIDLGGSVACACLPGFTGDGMQCAACMACGVDEYAAAPCTPNANTVCATCSTCGSQQYAASACTATSDTVCAACTTECMFGTFEMQPCTATTNRICAACTVCPAGTYEATPCNGLADATCSACGQGCLACQGPGATCTMCDLGLVLVDGQCMPPVCGNAVIEPGEMCDDGNTSSGDGCSNACAIESGYYCFGEPLSTCRAGNCVFEPATVLPLGADFELTGTGTPSAMGLTLTQRSTVRTAVDVAYPVLVEVDVMYSGDDLTYAGTRGAGLPDLSAGGEPTNTLRARLRESTGLVELATDAQTVIASTQAPFQVMTGVPYRVRFVDDGNSAQVEWFDLTSPQNGVGLQMPTSYHGTGDRAFVGGGDAGGVTIRNIRVCSAPMLPVTAGLAAHYSAIPSWTAVRDGLDRVSTWQDLSGGGHDLTAATGSEPLFNPGLIHGMRPGIDFSGAARLSSSPFSLTTDVTVFAVITHRTPAQWGAIAHHGSRDNDWSLEQNAFATDPNTLHWQTNNDNTNMDLTLTQGMDYVLAGRFAGNARYFSATDLVGSAPSVVSIVDASHTITTGSKQLFVGTSDANEASNAYVAELVYFARALSDSERDQVIDYLLRLWKSP